MAIQWRSMWLAAAFVALATSALTQSPSAPPVLHLTGDTRACHGRFDLTPTSLTWTSTWSKCLARKPHLLSQDANGWTLTITPTTSCKFEVVHIKNISAANGLPAGWWEASAFTTLNDYKQNPQTTQLSCNLF